jgi:putative transposase
VTPTFRKHKRTFNDAGHAHFLTYSCYQRLPLLSKDTSRQWVLDAFENVRQQFELDFWAYVIMPEHVHLLIHPRSDQYKIEHILAALKRPVSARAKAFLEERGENEWLRKLTVTRGTRESFRFWQAGGGYDHNMWNERPIREAINYIHANPVRRGLANDPLEWEWSSVQFWEGDGAAKFSLDPIEL